MFTQKLVHEYSQHYLQWSKIGTIWMSLILLMDTQIKKIKDFFKIFFKMIHKLWYSHRMEYYSFIKVMGY